MQDATVMEKIRSLIVDPSIEVDMTGFVFALVVSMATAVFISALYQLFYENRATGAQIHRSFLLISPSVTALFIAIQFSLPLSLGLLGALSIIRFRTPIKEPEEVGFIMVLIASAVVCATFQFLLLIALLSLVTLGLAGQRFVPRLFNSKRQDGVLVLTTERQINEQAGKRLERLLSERLRHTTLQSLTYTDEQGIHQYSFSGSNREGFSGLHEAIGEIIPVHRLNIFFNQTGSVL